LRRDGRFIVYSSNASGETEVYVRRYPALDRAWRVSYGGAIQPRWSGNGREIYYRGGGALVAVAFAGSGSEPAIGRPTVLFKDEYDVGQALLSNFDVTPDGRFLLLRRDAGEGELKLVLNWTQELQRILASGGVK